MISKSTLSFLGVAKSFYALRPELSKEHQELKKRCEESFYQFFKEAWHLIEPGIAFVDGWHLKAVCDHMQACYEGNIKTLIVNILPRIGKSSILTLFTPWCWTKSPEMTFMAITGTSNLAFRDNSRVKRIIETPWYNNLWPDVVLRSDVKSKKRIETTKAGHRLAFSMLSSVRGEGGIGILIDDPNSDIDAFSDVLRETKNEYIDFNISLRQNDPKRSFKIIIQQRVHAMDVTGHLLSKKDPTVIHLRLPLRFEKDYGCETIPVEKLHEISKFYEDKTKIWKDPRQKDQEELWPAKIDKKAIEQMEFALGSEYNIACQLQQRPAPKSGGLFKKDWFVWWKKPLPHPKKLMFTIQSWDTALVVSRDSCYSACTTWGGFEDKNGYTNLLLLQCFRVKLEYPDLKELITKCSQDIYCDSLTYKVQRNPPSQILIEKAASGLPLIQDLWRSGIKTTGFDPKLHGFKVGDSVLDASKIGRAKIASSFVEQGMIHIPTDKEEKPLPHCKLFLESCLNFPRGDGKDIVDSASQAIIKVLGSGDVYYKGQKPKAPYPTIYY